MDKLLETPKEKYTRLSNELAFYESQVKELEDENQNLFEINFTIGNRLKIFQDLKLNMDTLTEKQNRLAYCHKIKEQNTKPINSLNEKIKESENQLVYLKGQKKNHEKEKEENIKTLTRLKEEILNQQQILQNKNIELDDYRRQLELCESLAEKERAEMIQETI
jgi:hypothetical protein